MNGYDLLKGIGQAEETMAAEAWGSHEKVKKPKRWIGATAAAIVLIAAGVFAIPRLFPARLDASLDSDTVGIDLSPYFDMEKEEALAKMQEDGIIFDEEHTRPDAQPSGVYVIREDINGLTFYTLLNFAPYSADDGTVRLAGTIKEVQAKELSEEQRDSLNRIYKTILAEYGEPEEIGRNNLTIGTQVYGFDAISDPEIKQAYEKGSIFNAEYDVSGLQLHLRKDGGYLEMQFMALFPEYGHYAETEEGEEDTDSYGYFLRVYEASPLTAPAYIDHYFPEAEGE